jgi:hypothetical protein
VVPGPDSMDPHRLERLRAKASALLREQEAILVLANMMTHQRREQLDAEKRFCRERATVKRVSQLIEAKQKEVSALRSRLGVKVPVGDLLEWLEWVRKAPPGKVAMIRKHVIRQLFRFPEETFDRFSTLPDHAELYIYETKPEHHVDPRTIDWRLVEATLYEDMCALFNLAREHRARIDQRVDQLRARKETDALLHAAAAAAFYFVESYLNGLAFDYCVGHEAKLDGATRMLLTEWDDARNTPRYLSLRDKLLKYPRVVLGVEHAPLNEGNCPELAFLVGREKVLRDSIVHPSPKPDPVTYVPEKEERLFNVSFEEVGDIVDKAIALVRKVEELVHVGQGRLWWLRDRGPTGFFPKECFW